MRSQDDTTIGARLALIRGSKTQSEFADLVKSNKNTIGNYERGDRTPDAEFLKRLSELGYNVHWVVTGEGSMRSAAWQQQSEGEMIGSLLGDEEAQRERAARIEATTDLIREAKEEGVYEALAEFTFVKVYDVRASAGPGAAIDQERPMTTIAFRRDWLSQEGLSVNGLAAITADGDSMEPTVQSGSLLLIDTNQRALAGNRIYVLRMDGHLYAKRLQRLTDGSIRVSSDNPAYTDEVVEKEATGKLDIIGRVVWTGRRM